jgi:hypothetical protein
MIDNDIIFMPNYSATPSDITMINHDFISLQISYSFTRRRTSRCTSHTPFLSSYRNIDIFLFHTPSSISPAYGNFFSLNTACSNTTWCFAWCFSHYKLSLGTSIVIVQEVEVSSSSNVDIQFFVFSSGAPAAWAVEVRLAVLIGFRDGIAALRHCVIAMQTVRDTKTLKIFTKTRGYVFGWSWLGIRNEEGLEEPAQLMGPLPK